MQQNIHKYLKQHNMTVKNNSSKNSKDSKDSIKESKETKPSIEKLQTYLKNKYGNKAIKLSSSNPNKNNQILVSKKCFSEITDSNFKTFIAEESALLGNYIDIESLAKFLSTEANTRSTRGKYHELLDMILALYQIPIENDLPKFEVLDAKTFEMIYPNRVEYLICYWILHKISNDKFLSKYKFFDDNNLTIVNIYNYTASSIFPFGDISSRYTANGGGDRLFTSQWTYDQANAVSQINLFTDSGNWNGGTYTLYGVK